MPGNSVSVDNGYEVGRTEAAERRLGEMRVGRKEIVSRSAEVGEIAAAPARDKDLAPGLGRVIDEQDPAPPLAGQRRAEHSGRPGTDDNCVKRAGKRHRAVLAGCAGHDDQWKSDGGL